MTTSSAPCTTLSVMTTMSDLTDDFRLHAFAAVLSLLHHRFDRAQVFVDFANKSADAPTATVAQRAPAADVDHHLQKSHADVLCLKLQLAHRVGLVVLGLERVHSAEEHPQNRVGEALRDLRARARPH